MRIGLSQIVLYFKNRAHDGLEHGWYSFLNHHALFPIANVLHQDYDKLADSIDLLILTGGDDTTVRRIVEMRIATAMLKRQKPILGVCHGAFLLTELLGGKVDMCRGHLDTEHLIKYNDKYITVNSFHSNGILRVPETAKILATDENGRCESWIDNNIGAIVWHPERMENAFVPDEIMEFLNDKFDQSI